jgi:hypothetical protein
VPFIIQHIKKCQILFFQKEKKKICGWLYSSRENINLPVMGKLMFSLEEYNLRTATIKKDCNSYRPWNVLLHQKTVPFKLFSVPFTVSTVPYKPFSVLFTVQIAPCKPFSALSKAFQSFKAFPHPELPQSVIISKTSALQVIKRKIILYRYFRKTILFVDVNYINVLTCMCIRKAESGSKSK